MTQVGCEPANPSDIVPTGEDSYYRLAGDKKDKRGGYCLTVQPDGFAYGNFISFRTGEKGKWNSGQNNKKLTKEEKDANAARVKQAEADRSARQEKLYSEAAKAAQKTWADAKECDDHPYLTKKGIKSHGLRQLNGLLIVPMYYEGNLCSYQSIGADGEKLFLSGARKKGSFFKIGADTSTICIVEGMATGASVHEATGFCVFVAFDASSLDPVSATIRKLYPDNLVIICSDNDQWSTNQKGKLYNVGVESALQAATKIGGLEVHPNFPPDDMDLRTDWNDKYQTEGLEAVKAEIMAVVNAQPLKEEIPEYESFEYIGKPVIDDNGDMDLTGDMGLPFKILGFNDGIYYYFPFGIQQIFAYTASAHTLNNLMQLASLQDWKDWSRRICEEKLNVKEIPTYAFNEMKRIAQSRGVFIEGTRVRGCGAWMDAGRVVLHCGDKLLVNGTPIQPRDLNSRYVYAAAAQMLKHDSDPLTNTEAYALREICEMPTWENPLSGLLLAGWLVIAPVCAALAWRPHIWITGEAGSGKSTLLDEIIRPVLGEIAYNVDGGTTESAIRTGLGYDARPVIYDEAEGKGNKYSLMDGVLALAKLSSKGGVINKYGQRTYSARSSFCFSAINPPIKDFASETRISMMSLKKNKSIGAKEDFKKLMAKINETITADYGRRMLARTIKHMPVLLENIKVFRDAANTVIRDARAADQVSAMLAGLWLLGSTKLVTEKEATKWISERDWTQHTAISEESDPERLLHYIATSIVTVKSNKGSMDYTIGTLIASAIRKSSEVGEEWAKSALKQYSILARPDGIFFGNKNRNMQKILSDTDWAINWNKTIARIPGAQSISSQYFSSGDKQRAMKIPAQLFYGDKEPEPVTDDEWEIPLD